jgi:hypothetical protein
LGREHIIGIILNGVEGLNRIYSRYYGYAKCDPPAKPARPNAIKSLGLEKRAK